MGSIIVLLILLSSLSLSMHFSLAANSSSSSSNSRCRKSEWRALMEFKRDLNYSSSRLSSWTGRDCCSWHGITCHNSTGHVQTLDLGYYTNDILTGLNVYSPLSPWLFNLSRLEFLRICDSSLQGPIPNMFQKFTSLIYLELTLSSFDSPIPDSLCSLTSLSELHLGFCHLKGPLPPCLGNMTSLTIMDLEANELSGKIPSELGCLTQLKILDLSLNHLNSYIPSTLGHLSNLEYLDLGSNQLSGKIPSTLRSLTKLTWLNLGHNSLTGELYESFFEGFHSLEVLDMSENKGIVLNLSSQWIPPFQIGELFMSRVFIGTEFPLWLQTQRNLEQLSMSNADIFGAIPDWCQTAFPNLTTFDLSNNLLTGPVPRFHAMH